MKILLKFFIFSSLLLTIFAKERYELISVEQELAPPKIIQFNIESKRLMPDVYAFVGNLTVLKDLYDDTEVAGDIYRSLYANSQYVLTPFKIGRQSLKKFMNTAYKPIFMYNVDKCSNLPQFDGDWEPPFQANVYSINNCIGNASALPTFLTKGYYKLEVKVYHESNVYTMKTMFKTE